MLYAILCYNAEDVVMSWSQAEDEAVMDRLGIILMHDQDRRLWNRSMIGEGLALIDKACGTDGPAPIWSRRPSPPCTRGPRPLPKRTGCRSTPSTRRWSD